MDFQNIIAALGGKLGVELDGADGACGLAVDGVDVVLQDAGDWLLVHTDLGEPPPQDPAALHRAMLGRTSSTAARAAPRWPSAPPTATRTCRNTPGSNASTPSPPCSS
jgi:hypothetical protein